MMNGMMAAESMRQERRRLFNILRDFKPDHADYRPAQGAMTVAQHIHHTAHTLMWFREAAFGEGFNMDFEALEAENHRVMDLYEALGELNEVYDDYIAFVSGLTEADLLAPMPPNAILGEAPRRSVLTAQMDHTAHHRGALSVYLRMLGIKPRMIYAD